MISKFDLSKALYNEAKLIADANGYNLIVNGRQADRDINEQFIEETVIFGDDSSVGLASLSSDFQRGIYQISVHTPKTNTKWTGLQVIDVFQNAFVRGLSPSFNGQALVVENSSLAPMMYEDAFYVHHLSVVFTVIN